jgi:uncharacterized protein
VSTYPVRQFQILARNPAQAAAFYQQVFGWTFSADNALAYREIETGGIRGGIWPAPQDGHGMAQLFLEVPDVRAAVIAAENAGAKVVIPASVLPDGDEMAVIVDPEGLTFGLFRHRTP